MQTGHFKYYIAAVEIRSTPHLLLLLVVVCFVPCFVIFLNSFCKVCVLSVVSLMNSVHQPPPHLYVKTLIPSVMFWR